MSDQNSSVTLTLGAERIDRVICKADEYLRAYRDNPNDTGSDYFDYQPITPRDALLPEDLAVTLLINSQVGWKAFRSIQKHAHEIRLADLPDKPLESTFPEERQQVAALIARIAQWDGFAASVTTKVLHKKRPALIPILDNQAIFGAYMNPKWPKKLALSDSIKDEKKIIEALEWIYFDLNRPENELAWKSLQRIEPTRSRIQLFDSIWWVYFRKIQPNNTTIVSE